MVVHKEVLAPLGPRFGVMAKQYVIKAEPQKLLRGKQRHACLFGSSVSFSLVALYTGGDEICGSAFAALCTRENVVERKVLCVPVIAAVLTAITVADIHPCTLHCGLPPVSADINIMTQPDNRRNTENGRRRAENVVAIVLFDKDGAAEPQANRTGDANGAERFVRKVQKQYSSG